MSLIQWIPKNDSKILIVGEAPGQQEIINGIPFCGPEGKYLEKMLKAAGIDKWSCYMTNVVHEKPPKNDFTLLSSNIIANGQAQLANDVRKFNPNIIIAIGKQSLLALCDKKGIYKYRGSVMPSTNPSGFKVLATVHPGGLIKGNPEYEPVAINDLAKAKEESETPEINYPVRDIEIITSPNEAIDLFESFTNHPDPLACDVECIKNNGLLTAYGIATSPTKAYSVAKEPLRSYRVLRALSRFCDSQTPKIFHNALFDALHNAIFYNIHNSNIYFDTMLAQHAVMPILPKSLGFCGSIYTKEPYWKDDSESAFEPSKAKGPIDWKGLYYYNAKDCCLTFEIYEQQKKQLDKRNAWKPFNLMMRLVLPALRAMLDGIKIDRYAIEEFAEENEKAIESLYKILYKTIGDINPRSQPQKKHLLYDVWKFPEQKKGGKVTTDKNALDKLERFPTPYKPSIGLIRNMMDYNKRRDFYKLKLDRDGRIRTSLKLHGTITGRFASGASITGSGKNLLNIPKRTRHFYVADPGKILIQMDLSQAEARIVAALCKDMEWLREFDAEDLHTKVATFLYNIPKEQVRKEFERMTAKRVSHASHYLLGPTLLSMILKVPLKEAKIKKEKYYQMRPKLEDWQERVKVHIRKEKKIVTTFGRVINFPGQIQDGTYASAIACEPQSTCGDYLNHAIVSMYEEGPEEFEFNHQVYDSILFQVPDTIEPIVRNIQAMKNLAEIEIDIHGIPLVIPCDFEIGYSWGELHEIKEDVMERKNIEKVYNAIQ